MRIIAGTARGRRLATPPKGGGVQTIRPTADRAREALFSIIGTEVVGATVLDLFAGTGALGLEALSRGAHAALFIDWQRLALEIVRRNIVLCGFAAQATVVKRDLARGLLSLQPLAPAPGFSLVFLDPPYGRQLAEKALAELGQGGLVAAGALVVAEEDAGAAFAETYGILHQEDRRRYGDTGFWFYRSLRQGGE